MQFTAYKGSEPYSLYLRGLEIFQCQRDCQERYPDFFAGLSCEEPVQLPSPVFVCSGSVHHEYIRREHAVQLGQLIVPQPIAPGYYKASFHVRARDGFWKSAGGAHLLNNCVPCELTVTLSAGP